MKELFKDNETYVSYISKKMYDGYILEHEKQIKGESKYDNYWMIEYLPKGKEFYVLEDYECHTEYGCLEYIFCIVTTYRNKYVMISTSN